MADDSQATQNKQAAQGCAALLVIVVAVGIFLFSGGNGDSTSSEPAITLPDGTEVEESTARFMCEDRTKDQLRAPSTASFVGPFSGDYTAPRKIGNTWRHTVIVDAENAFGAKVRATFECVIDGDANTVVAEPR